jgi:dienelactone hydrolase
MKKMLRSAARSTSRNYGDSGRPPVLAATANGRDLAAAVARARADGAARVFLMGASFGGAAALTYGPALRLAGLISLSGEARLDDMMLQLYRRAGSKDKRTAFLPGSLPRLVDRRDRTLRRESPRLDPELDPRTTLNRAS